MAAVAPGQGGEAAVVASVPEVPPGNSRRKVWWSPAPPGGPPPRVPSPARRLDSTPAAQTQLLYPSPCRFPNSHCALYSPVPHPPFHLFLLPVKPLPVPASSSPLASSFSCLTLFSHFIFLFFPPAPSSASTCSPPCLLPSLHLRFWVLCLPSELCVLPFIPCPDLTPLSCSFTPPGLSAFRALS